MVNGTGSSIKPYLQTFEAVPKCQIMELQPIKTAVLQPVGRKTARAGYKITDFGTGSSLFGFGILNSELLYAERMLSTDSSV
jgi:hypothetical protein